MIIGHGDIASVLPDRKNVVFFASGVSNSSETRASEYKREVDLLMRQNKNKHLVYFSSLTCFFNPGTRYARHKKRMENLVKSNFKKYTIIRMGTITWGTNPHTLINFLRNRYKSGKPLEIRKTFRYIVDTDEFLHWISLIPKWSCEMNITGRRLTVKQIVDEFVIT